jgi:hypothetical protein
MHHTKQAVRSEVLQYASRLRFPKLFMLVAGLFALDLLIPDVIPLIDEILLGLTTLLLGSLREHVAVLVTPRGRETLAE